MGPDGLPSPNDVQGSTAAGHDVRHGEGASVLLIANADVSSTVDRWLRADDRIALVACRDAAQPEAGEDAFDCVVVDLQTVAPTGDLVISTQLRSTYPDAALVVLVDAEEQGQEALRCAVDDYVLHDDLSDATVGRAVGDALERRVASGGRLQGLPPPVMAQMPYPLLRLSTEGDVVFVNDTLVNLLGYPDANTLLRTRIEDVVIDEAQFTNFQQLMRRDGAVHGHEFELQRYNGKSIWVLVLSREFQNLDGRYWQTGLIDITARKRAEQAAVENEIRYRTLFEDSPVALWEEDFSALQGWFEGLRAAGVEDLGRYLEDHPDDALGALDLIQVVNVNAAGLKLIGAENKEQVLGRLQRLEETATNFHDELVALWEGCGDYQADISGVTLDGRAVTHTLQMAVPTIGDQLDLSSVIVAVHDLTDRFEQDRARQAAELRFRHAFDAAPIGMAIADLHGRMTKVNTAFTHLVGRPASELTDVNWRDLADTDDVKALEARFAELPDGAQSPREGELRLVRPDGTKIRVAARASVVEDGEGRPSYVIFHVVETTNALRSPGEPARPTKEAPSEKSRQLGSGGQG